MADGGKIITFGLIGLAAWWVYENFFATPAVTAATATPGAASAPAAAPAAPPVSTPAAPSLPAYSGPSLASLQSSLQSAVSAAYGSDPAITCGSGLGAGPRGGSSLAAPTNVAGQRVQISQLPGVRARISFPAAAAPTAGGASRCSTYQATYDVFNWYLQNRAGLPASLVPPSPPDHTTVVSLSAYWAWVAPLLQSQVSGLSGMRGLGWSGLAAPFRRPYLVRRFA